MQKNPSSHWLDLVRQMMLRNRCNLNAACRFTAQEHPDAATLMSAYGKTRQLVSFFNSRLENVSAPEKTEPAKKLAAFANAKMKASGLPYWRAYNAVCQEHPELVVPFRSKTVRFANAGTAAEANASGGTPLATSTLKAMLRLPASCTQEEFAAAWNGNGNTVDPLNPGRCFAGLVDYVQKQKGLDYAAAITAAKAAYPALWELVDRIAKQEIIAA